MNFYVFHKLYPTYINSMDDNLSHVYKYHIWNIFYYENIYAIVHCNSFKVRSRINQDYQICRFLFFISRVRFIYKS